MKIRSGFVSNSSSSSYVVVLHEKDYEDLMTKLSPLARHLCKEMGCEDKKLGEDTVKVISWWSGNINSFEYIKPPSDELVKQYIKENWEKDEEYDFGQIRWDAIWECWEHFEDLAGERGIVVRNSDS